MAKPLKQIVKDLEKANGDYHEAVEELLECEDLNVEQRAVVGTKAHVIFGKMKELNSTLSNYMS
jgi:hypothetical protein